MKNNSAEDPLSPNRDFWLNAAKRLFWVVPLFGMLGWLLFKQLHSSYLSPLSSEMQANNAEFIAHLSKKLGGFQDTMLTLQRELTEKKILFYDQPIDQRALTSVFHQFLSDYPHLFQIRWINMDGQEVVKLHKQNNDILVFTGEQLINKGQRPYMQAAQKLDLDEVLFSEINLNQEFGEIEYPLRYTVRTIVHTAPINGFHDGYLVLNFSLNQLFDQVQQYTPKDIDTFLVDHHGYWLSHPNQNLAWGQQLKQPGHSLPSLFPAAWEQLKKEALSGLFIESGRAWQYHWVKLDIRKGVRLKESPLLFLSTSKPDSYSEIWLRAVSLSLLISGVLFLLIAGGLVTILWKNVLNARLLKQVHVESLEAKNANIHLKQSLQRQTLLQDELVESRKLSSLGVMVAGVAHELNTPLGSAIMAVSKLQQKLKDFALAHPELANEEGFKQLNHQSQTGFKIANDSLNRARDLINSFKRTAAERQLNQYEKTDLALLLHDFNVSLQPRLKRSTIKTKLFCPKELVVTCQPGVILQILQNLVDNALHHAFDKHQPGLITIELTQLKNEIILRVIDNGCGIDTKMLPTIFDPFVTTSRHSGRTGLGLYLVHQLVYDVLKGSLSLNTGKEGSTFEITFPLSQNKQ